jgi:hypothetical protein
VDTRHLLPVGASFLVLAYWTKSSWLGCVGLPFTVDLWLHQHKTLACESMTLFYERPEKVVATCGRRRDAAIVRDGESFSVCGRRFDAEIARSYPEERYRLRVGVPAGD